jgi:predicted transcriptional regulator
VEERPDRSADRPASSGGGERGRTYKGYRVYAYIALTRLFAELDLDLGQPDLASRVVSALADDRGRVSKEEILHAIRSNSHMTDKVLEFLGGEGFIRVAQDERGYDIRITPKGVEHLGRYHQFYRDLYRRELAQHYRYVRPPSGLG